MTAGERLKDRLRRSVRSPQPALWAALALALALFHLTLGGRLVGAKAAYWANPHGDMGQMIAGELAALREPWGLPFGVVRSLTAPAPVSIVYTDSIPWLTALLKLTHLGPHLSLLGTFLLIAWVAQAAAMYLLLRACGVARRWTLFVGAALALLTPSFLSRQIGHIALSGHALEIAALACAVHAVRKGLGRPVAAAFVGLGALATATHAYHVPPVTLMLAAALGGEVLQRRPGALWRGLTAGAAYVAAVGATAWGFGYFVGRGESGGMAALGYYEMNLVGPVLPQASWLAGQRWTGAWFTHPFDPTGGQIFEGHNYLGAGVLLALAIAGLSHVRPLSLRAADREVEGSRDALRRWGPLGAALVLLTLYALGPRGWLGYARVWNLPLPTGDWAEPLALFRAHGRFFWTVGYAALAFGVVGLDRLRGPALRTGLLGLVLLLQLADSSELLRALHQRFGRSEPLVIPAAVTGAAFEGRGYRAYPTYFCTGSWYNQVIIRQLSLAAQRRHAFTNSASTARGSTRSCGEPPPVDALSDAAPGDRRVTVVMGENAGPTPLTARFSGRTDCYAAGKAWFCGRDLAGVPGLTHVHGAQLTEDGKVLADVALTTRVGRVALLTGWSKPERTGVWSDGPRAVLRLPAVAAAPGTPVLMSLEALGYIPPGRAPQRAQVSVRGRRLIEWRLEDGGYSGYRVTIPADLLDPRAPLEVVIDLPDAVSPDVVVGVGYDSRRLGIGVRRAVVFQAR